MNRYYAMKAGPQAKQALDYLSQAAQAAKPESKAKALRLARRHLADVSREHHPELVEQLEGRILWEEGWRPETWDAERNAPREQGPSINPQTGQQEFFAPFDWVKEQFGKIKSKADELITETPMATKEGLYHAGAAAGDFVGLDLAASNLKHYLDGSGTPVIADPDLLTKYPYVSELQQRNIDNLQAWLGTAGIENMKDGEVRRLGREKTWESTQDIIPENSNPDIKYGLGKSYLHSTGDFNARRSGDTITIDGEVVHSVPDIYNFERNDASLRNNLLANWPADLEDSGRAKSYGFLSQWSNPMHATIKIGSGGQMSNPLFTWGQLRKLGLDQ